MKKYLLTFICVFCISALFSTFYVLISHNNSSNITPIQNKQNISTTQNNIITDFTQPIEIETIEKQLIKEPLEFSMPVKSNEIGMKFSNEQLIFSWFCLKYGLLYN